MTEFTFEALRRFPDVESRELVAVDATDRLVLDEAAELLSATAPGSVAVLGDRHGAMTLGAVALHGARDLRVYSDQLSGELALLANAERAGLTGTFTVHGLDEVLTSETRLVLLQLPRSLEALEEIAATIARCAAPDVVVVAGGRIKHMSRTMNDVLARHLGTVDVRHARQKSRVLIAHGPRSSEQDASATRAGAAGSHAFPATERHDDLGLTVCAHGEAFAGTRIDVGTRFLLGFADRMAPTAVHAVDLGCGTGVLAVALAMGRPDLQVTATDDSWAAVISARATAQANGVADRVHVTRDNAAAAMAPESADLVVLNPPFHVGAAVHRGVAVKLFTAAARILRPGGELWAVWNSSLIYRPDLEKLVGPTRQAGRNPKFTVTVSTRG